jgi:tRNA threonylcarbamoyladenosine biosynthesis protein TsaE
MAGNGANAGPTRGATLDFISHSPEQTRRLGWRLGQHARAGDLFLLSGTFGAGKTALTQGLAAGLGVADRVTSPSFALVNEHDGHDAEGSSLRLYHIDLYRLETEAEVASIGLEDMLDDPAGICAIEWPDRLGERVAREHLLIMLAPVSETKRRLAFLPRGARPGELLAAIRAEAFGVGS